MLNSKPINLPKTEDYSKLYLWWIQTKLCKWYSDWTWKFFGRPWSLLKKSWDWYRNVWRFDFDFDGHSLFAILEYKLIRLQDCLVNGPAIQMPEDLKALKLAIKLAKRLKENKYEEVGHSRIEKKWGKSIVTFKKLPDGNSQMNSRRSKAKGKKQQEQAWQESLEQYRLADIRMKREERILYAILHKYLRVWWD